MATRIDSFFGGGTAQPGSIKGVQGMLGQAQQAGLFDPFGSARLRAILRQRAMQNYGAQIQNAQGQAGLYGLDPYQQRAALAGAAIQGTGQAVNALNNAEYQGATSNIPFYQGLFNNQVQFQQQQALQRQAQKAQRQGGFGQLIGTGLGLLAGPVGGAIGGAIGGRLGGGGGQAYNSLYQPGNAYDPFANYPF